MSFGHKHLRPELRLRQQRWQSMIPAVYEFRELDYCPIRELFEWIKVLIIMTKIIIDAKDTLGTLNTNVISGFSKLNKSKQQKNVHFEIIFKT